MTLRRCSRVGMMIATMAVQRRGSLNRGLREHLGRDTAKQMAR
jgi:hypothetical protein